MPSVFFNDKIDQGLCITFSLIFWYCCDILDFQHTAALIRYDTLAFNAVVIEHIHPAFIKIPVYHIFLLVRQQQSKMFFFVLFNLDNFHRLPL